MIIIHLKYQFLMVQFWHVALVGGNVYLLPLLINII